MLGDLGKSLKSCGAIYPANVSHALHINIDIIAEIGLVSSTLSLFGSSSIVIFTICKGLLKHEHVQPLFHLSLADLILSVLWITSTLKYFIGTEFDHPAYTAVSCFIWQLLAEIVHLATFFLTVNYALHVYLKMITRTRQVHMITNGDVLHCKALSVCKRLLYFISWILPVILMMPILVNVKVSNISSCQKCVILIDVPVLLTSHVSWSYGYKILASCLTFCTFTIIFVYALFLNLYWKAVPGFRTDHERKQFSNMQSRITLYMLVFIICWAPAFMISYHKWINHSKPNVYEGSVDLQRYFGLYIFQAICAPLQGLLNSIVYGWSKKTFRSSTTVNARRDSTIASNHVDFISSVSLSEDEDFYSR